MVIPFLKQTRMALGAAIVLAGILAVGGAYIAHAASAAITADSSRVYLSGTVQFINGASMSVFNTPLKVVVVDASGNRPLVQRNLDYNTTSMTFSASLLKCGSVFYFERASDNLAVSTPSINAGSGIMLDGTGQNFRLTNCNNFSNYYVQNGTVQVVNNMVRLSVPNRTLRLIDGSQISMNNTSLSAVIFDGQTPLQIISLNGNNDSFPASSIPCGNNMRWYYTAGYGGLAVNSSTLNPGSGVQRDSTGQNFQLTNCAYAYNNYYNQYLYYNNYNNYYPYNYNYNAPQTSTLQVVNGMVKIVSPTRTLQFVDGSTFNMNLGQLEAVIFDGRSFLDHVPLRGNNDSFPVTLIPCGSNVRWYYDTTGVHIPISSTSLVAGQGVQRDSTGQNFQLTNCSTTGYSYPNYNYNSNYNYNYPYNFNGTRGLVAVNGTDIQLVPAGSQVTLTDNSTVNPHTTQLDAVVFSPSGQSPRVIVPLSNTLSFGRNALYGDIVWYYQVHSSGVAVNSTMLQTGQCVARQGTNFKESC